MIDTPKARLQEPLAHVGTMLIRQMHQHGHEEAVREDQVALGVMAACANLHRL